MTLPHASAEETKKQHKTLRRLLKDFLSTEASGGIIMMFAAFMAIIVANLDGFNVIYQDFIHTPVHIGIGDTALALPLKNFVKDILMVIFFLFVGLELKREMQMGF